MTTLTLPAILADPWNAVAQELPTAPEAFLLELAYMAANYCMEREQRLMHAARRGLYSPPEWDRLGIGVHEFNEGRTLSAETRVIAIMRLYRERFGHLAEFMDEESLNFHDRFEAEAEQ